MIMAQKTIRVFQDEEGQNYARQLSAQETEAWLAKNPTHKLIR
jgi:hypothetical protein|tara:strand:- start:288 stop:416 length:129 start_codon:yes stop_codon:yes gene_type:complete